MGFVNLVSYVVLFSAVQDLVRGPKAAQQQPPSNPKEPQGPPADQSGNPPGVPQPPPHFTLVAMLRLKPWVTPSPSYLDQTLPTLLDHIEPYCILPDPTRRVQRRRSVPAPFLAPTAMSLCFRRGPFGARRVGKPRTAAPATLPYPRPYCKTLRASRVSRNNRRESQYGHPLDPELAQNHP